MPRKLCVVRHHDHVTTSVERAQPVWCATCGTQVDEVPVTWTVQTSERGLQYLCESCTRTNVRAIEGQLPAEWW
jgi:hypothetical protein